MAVYAIGDVQGCYDELLALLGKIAFDPKRDHLWFTGDLVNRGPQSLRVLRFVQGLGHAAHCVLGNHDLHLLAVASGHERCGRHDTLQDVLAAPDRDELLDWLRQLPLLHHDTATGFTLIHAGLPPQWDLAQARACAAEVEAVLRGSACDEFLMQMYADEPLLWSDSLSGVARLRFITNCFTRLRFCDEQGRLALHEKGPPGSQPAPYLPWFEIPHRRSRDLNIVFGHWSALREYAAQGVHALDTGCVWGGSLSALRLDADEHTQAHVVCRAYCSRF